MHVSGLEAGERKVWVHEWIVAAVNVIPIINHEALVFVLALRLEY